MEINFNILEENFNVFTDFIEEHDKRQFTKFSESKFIDNTENYKYSVYYIARELLDSRHWEIEDIGTGRIKQAVISAMPQKVKHNGEDTVNNLYYWLDKDNLSKLSNNKSLEQLFYDFYKSKRKDSDCFQNFIEKGISYNLIAYLCYIKEIRRFLPISQIRFDKIFNKLGISDFKTNGKVSWENYTTYLDLIKQTQKFLKTKDKDTSILDAHSFLWVIGRIYFDVEENKETKQKNGKSEKADTLNEIESKEKITLSKLHRTNDEVQTEGNLEFINESSGVLNEISYADEIPQNTEYELFEGLKKTVTVNAYERNSNARELCIKHWKAVCSICGFDFEKEYGEIGKGFIHVHHLTPISQIGNTYKINPINDLIPVCPNCHSIIHKCEPPFSIEDMRKILIEQRTHL